MLRKTKFPYRTLPTLNPAKPMFMKKILTLSLLLPTVAFGQSLVGTSPENRTALLEDFTGIHCVYCPDGHVIMAQIAAANPGKVSMVGVHAGGFAAPGAGEPDFRTPEGTALDNFYQIPGYPSGVINRHAFPGGAARSRGSWVGDVAEMLSMPSPVNLGVESNFDTVSQELTVHVQLYYTSDSPGGDDHISVLVTEDHIIGPQTGGSANYDHLHVLRDYFTGIWGEAVSTTSTGTTVDRTYTLTVPAAWNIANCKVTAFVGEYQSDVYQARTVDANGGFTLIAGSLGQVAAPYQSGASASATSFSSGLTNQIGNSANYVVSLVATDAPASWGTAIEAAGSTIASGATITVADAATIQINVNITPDNTPGIGSYLLTVTSVDFPGAALMQQELHVISGVHDLIVTNPEAEPWKALYTASMVQAGELAYAHATRDQFVKFGQANALGDVLNVYRNISWTFPSLTNDEVAVLKDFMDNGGNLMIAGQDIGWDQSGATSSYGTTTTRSFYTTYMLATFVNDGSNASNTVNFTDADAIFGAVPNSGIANVFSGNTYPDQITPIAPATGILTYNTGTNIGAIRAQTANYKLVYFGVGPEQMANASVGRSMIQLSHDWFYGTVGITEFDAAIGSLGQAYPVPANDQLNIPVNTLLSDATLEVFDAMGRSVMQQSVARSSHSVILNTSDLSNGVYSYRLSTATSAGSARSFVVSH